jgi:hypothetical protein
MANSTKLGGIALLFAITGAASSFIAGGETFRSYLIGIPFGILAAYLIGGTPKKIVVTAALISLVWIVAFYTALELDRLHNTYLGMCMAGLVGGAGVLLSIQIGGAKPIFWKTVGIGALIGAVAAIPFCWNYASSDTPWGQFAIWQAAVGTYVYLAAGKVGTLPAYRSK